MPWTGVGSRGGQCDGGRYNQRHRMNVWERIFGNSAEVMDWLHVHGIRVLTIVVVAVLLVWMLRALGRRLLAIAEGHRDMVREQQLRTLVSVSNGAITAIIFTLAGLQILQQLDIAVGPLIAGAGVVGVAVGFGAQSLIKDVLTGFFVLLDDQFQVGDTVRAAGVQGKVERLTLRRTVLRDLDGTVHFIPNSELKVVSNQTRDWALASLNVAVDYPEASEAVMGVLQLAASRLRDDPGIAARLQAEPTVAGIERIHGDEVDYLIQVRTVPGAQADILRALRAAIKSELERAGMTAWAPRMRISQWDNVGTRGEV